MNAEVLSLADQIHEAVCNDTPRCPRWGPLFVEGECLSPHQQHYADMAEAIISRLEPEIGIASVFLAVGVIL